MSRHIEQRFGLREGRGYSYFCAYGSQAGAMWRQFREVLDAEVPPAEHRAAVDAAVDTFRAFHRQCVGVAAA